MLAAAYLKEPSPMNAEKLGKYLKTWLASHILGVDKKYGPYLHEQGIH
jgi:hemerythrin